MRRVSVPSGGCDLVVSPVAFGYSVLKDGASLVCLVNLENCIEPQHQEGRDVNSQPGPASTRLPGCNGPPRTPEAYRIQTDRACVSMP